MTSAAANRLALRTSPQPPSTVPAEPTLRETYIDARGHILAHAASPEWQRITALWDTVNTLARQTDDSGIRAVVARSADAISDHADALRRKTTLPGNQRGATAALAGRNRRQLRTTFRPSTTPRARIAQRRSHYGADPQALPANARQVAQRVQRPPRPTTLANE